MSSKSSKQQITNLYLLEAGIIIVIALATVVINWKMLRDGINGMNDLKPHLTWLQHFSKQFAEGIWYPRWLAGTNYGYGSPTFVFYPPLVYYLGSLFKLAGLNTENTVITLFSLALFLSGITFYIYGRSRWGIVASLVGALAYMTAPYLALDIYWRGGLASIFVQPWIPLIWWLTEKAMMQPKWRVALALIWTTMVLTHAPSLLLCAIVWLPYTLFFLLVRPWKNVLLTILSAGIGLGIASFYLLPAVLEQSFVNVETMKGVLGGYKAAILGTGLPLFPLDTKDLVSIPYIFILQSGAIATLTIVAIIWCRKNAVIMAEVGRWLSFAIILAFLMSSLSLPIWNASSTLQMVQFPWRFLQIFSFVGAVLFTIVVSGITQLSLRLKLLLSLIVVGILLINFGYTYKLSRQFITLRNPGKGSVEHLAHIKKILEDPYTDELRDVKEYRPLLKGSSSPPVPRINQPKFSVIRGKASIVLQQWESYKRVLDVTAAEISTIKIRTYYYPAWHLYVNNNSYPIDVSKDGTMMLTIEKGHYTVELLYQWTPAFTVGVGLSIMSLFILSVFERLCGKNR